ncbi:DUF6531 domain-containing protein [Ideonella sp.]|uniref:DUF6531 domain-containing protein n=1 Tax=Ideonella sp. TaxID=1929293 RepID=UPI0035B113D5
MRHYIWPVLASASLMAFSSVHAIDRVEVTAPRPDRSADEGWLRLYKIPEGYAANRDNGFRGPAGGRQPPSSEDNTAIRCDVETSKPVMLTTGEKLLPESDFQTGGLSGVALGRTYRSRLAAGQLFGPKWASSLATWKVTGSGQTCVEGVCSPALAVLALDDGSQYRYTKVAGPGYSVAGNNLMGKLFYSAPGWTLAKDGYTYLFNSSGLLSSVKRNGALIRNYFYTNGVLTSVSNGQGQVVKLQWTGDRVTQVIDPAGGTWTFAYGSQGMLDTVTSPSPNAVTRRYHYEDHADTTLLTGVSVNGVRYSTYSYYSDKRVRQSGLSSSNGEDVDSITYGSLSATVTDARGQSTTYRFSNVNGELKLTALSRPATSTCPAAAASIAYDANGYPDYDLDWNGVKTDYTYDSEGRLTKAVRDAGTSQRQTVSYTWDDWRLVMRELQGSDDAPFFRSTYRYYITGDAAGRLEMQVDEDLIL